MPKEFERCRKAGGRIRTIKPKGKDSKTYMHICCVNDKCYKGEVKKAKTTPPRKRSKK